MSKSFVCAMMVVMLALGACAGVPQTERPTALSLVPTAPTSWREDFDDPELRALLRRADLTNLDIKSALARLERAEADAALARSGRSIQIDTGLSGVTGGETFGRSRVGASPTLEASYEVDLWGRLKQEIASADSETAANAIEVEAARHLVAARTVTAYVDFRYAQQAEASARRRSGFIGSRRDLIRIRAGAGSASEDDVLEAGAMVADAAAAEQAASVEAIVQRLRLQALLGGVADLEISPGNLPEVVTVPGETVASDDVDARPEVRAAFARLQAADSHRAAAIAATRPGFRIVAALGTPDAAFAALLDVRALAWAAAASLTHAVVDGGANRARVAQASADADLAELAWRKAVVDGWLDLQSTVQHDAAASAELALARRHFDGAQTRFRLAERRHHEGVIDGVAMATARVALEDAGLAVAQAQAQLLRQRVLLSLARGGAA
ncbi:TolC family protein [uncultured Brevundimonas sp.]|uniref:TolC family protein n=1 Tax=uncultured Brevundimonas sp. TaxID=213418 RepID=UPI0030EDC442|tara:strand:- start:39806 stop:41131 length:1326 start_codon:yes stop_codon:yes gene_type:complete